MLREVGPCGIERVRRTSGSRLKRSLHFPKIMSFIRASYVAVCCRKTAVDPCERVHRAPTFAIQFGDDLAILNAKVSLLAEGDIGVRVASGGQCGLQPVAPPTPLVIVDRHQVELRSDR